MTSLGSLPPRYRNAPTNRVVEVIPTRTMTNVAREGAGVNIGCYVR